MWTARKAYLNTAGVLRQLLFPASDVAARVRLSKTPEAYQARRVRNAEQTYESPLTAGRTKWVPGERVRIYRVVGGTSVWIPDPSKDIAFDDGEGAEGRTGEHELYGPLRTGRAGERKGSGASTHQPKPASQAAS